MYIYRDLPRIDYYVYEEEKLKEKEARMEEPHASVETARAPRAAKVNRAINSYYYYSCCCHL